MFRDRECWLVLRCRTFPTPKPERGGVRQVHSYRRMTPELDPPAGFGTVQRAVLCSCDCREVAGQDPTSGAIRHPDASMRTLN
jgi:hypothetical protein